MIRILIKIVMFFVVFFVGGMLLLIAKQSGLEGIPSVIILIAMVGAWKAIWSYNPSPSNEHALEK